MIWLEHNVIHSHLDGIKLLRERDLLPLNVLLLSLQPFFWFRSFTAHTSLENDKLPALWLWIECDEHRDTVRGDKLCRAKKNPGAQQPRKINIGLIHMHVATTGKQSVCFWIVPPKNIFVRLPTCPLPLYKRLGKCEGFFTISESWLIFMSLKATTRSSLPGSLYAFSICEATTTCQRHHSDAIGGSNDKPVWKRDFSRVHRFLFHHQQENAC
jgi:hypothetical protein